MSTKWAKKAEIKVVKDFGGKPTPNSGATPFSKADGKAGNWRQDVKSTKKDSYKVTTSTIKKLEKDAGFHGCSPMLIVNFVKVNRQVVLVPEYACDCNYPLEDDNSIEPYSHGYRIKIKEIDTPYLVMTGEVAKVELADLT